MSDGKGWTHEEARRHTLAERLHERCRTYGGRTCSEKGLPEAEWCERCLAVRVLSDTVDPRKVTNIEQEEWRALAEADTLHMLPAEALIASIKDLATRLLEVTYAMD